MRLFTPSPEAIERVKKIKKEAEESKSNLPPKRGNETDLEWRVRVRKERIEAEKQLDKAKEENEGLIKSVNRFNENCFLFDHIGQLVELSQNRSHFMPNRYKNFIMLNDEPGEVVQELMGKKGLDSLFYLTPAQTALLVPRIQIFKVMYKDGKSNEPFERELIFNDFTSPKTIENITNNKMTRGDDVGIKSFEYEFSGTNAVEGGKARCTLKLFFQNIQSLVIDAPKDGVSYRDLILRNKNMFLINASGKKASCDSKDSDREYESRYFQIKVVAGWADPVDPTNTLMNRNLIEAIRNSKTVLFLTLRKHDIDFKENGAVELSLEYHGAIEGVLSGESSNIFYLSEYGKYANKRKEEEKEKNKKTDTQANPPSVKPDLKSVINATLGSQENEVSVDPKKQSDFEKVKTLIAETYDKQEKYSRLLKLLYTYGRIMFTDVDEKQIETFTKESTVTSEEIKELAKNGESITSENLSKFMLSLRNKKRNKDPLKIKYTEKEGDKAFNIAFGAIKMANSLHDPDDSTWGEKGKEIVKQGWSGKVSIRGKNQDERNEIVDIGATKISSDKDAKVPEGKKRINFFFLGDLLEIVLNVLTSPERDDNFNIKVILGPFIFDDPITGQKVEYSLADVPISLNLFLTWYMDKVVKPQKETYLLSEFIRELIIELVIPILEKDKCYFDVGITSPRLTIGFYSVPDIGNTMVPGKQYKLDDLRAGRKKISSGDKHHNIKNLVHYLYIYVMNDTINSYRGNYDEDVKRGVYHLVLGADRGLVRSIKFTKQNIPRGEEVMADAATKDQQGFSGFYNAHVVMVGNTVFELGSRLYIDASKITSFLGGKTVQGSLAHQLRIGGYYKIIKINHSTSKDDNITEIEAKWEFSGVDSGCSSVEKVNKRKENTQKGIVGALGTIDIGASQLVDKAVKEGGYR